jgi:hypothetical protein
MNGTSAPSERRFGAGLPGWARPRDVEPRGTGQTRLVETTVLLLVGLLLVVATVNDVVRQTHVNHRLAADLRTWRAYTGHAYHNLSVEQNQSGRGTREVICGNTTPGGPKERVQICLLIIGAVVDGRRTVAGGWYLPAKHEDTRGSRYGCFGSAAGARLCPR